MVLHNPDSEDGVNLEGNFPRQHLAAVGTMEDFYGEDPRGLWTLEVIDSVDQEGGELLGWGLNVNDGWAGSSLFIGNDLRTDGWLRSRSGVEITMGGDLVLKNTGGEETLRIDGEVGLPIPTLSCTQRSFPGGPQNNNPGPGTCEAGETLVSAVCNRTDERFVYAGGGGYCFRYSNPNRFYNGGSLRCCSLRR